MADSITITVTQIQQAAKAFTLRIIGDLKSSGGEIFRETVYTFSIAASGTTTIALPKPATGTRRYEAAVPRDVFDASGAVSKKTDLREFFVSSETADTSLAALLAAGGAATDTVLDYVAAEIDGKADIAGDDFTGAVSARTSFSLKDSADAVLSTWRAKTIYDIAIGYEAGNTTMTGTAVTALGYRAGKSNTTGNRNAFFGTNAGEFNTTGRFNSFFGALAGYANTTGIYNTYLGADAGQLATTGDYNTFVGAKASQGVLTGSNNAAFGAFAGGYLTSGNQNAFLGTNAGQNITTGSYNTLVGVNAGAGFDVPGFASAVNNTFLGYQAGYYAAGSRGVFLGHKAGYNETLSNKLYISNTDTATPLIFGTFDPLGGAAGEVRITGSFYVNDVQLGNARITDDGNELIAGGGQAQLLLNESSKVSTLGDSIQSGNGTKITIDDANQTIDLIAPNVFLNGITDIGAVLADFETRIFALENP